jgi:hypothetical protein
VLPRTLLILIAAGLSAPPAMAGPPALIVAVYAKPGDRPALRRAVEGAQAAALRDWKARGLLTGYRLLFARYPDRAGWDALEMLRFADDAALARWRKTVREPLDPSLLALAASLETTTVEFIRGEGVSSSDPSVLVIPYQALVPPAEYSTYLDGYTIPQFRGWMKAGALDGFDIATTRYPAGRPWNALITLRYRDDAALGRREELVRSTRAALAADPRWKAFADAKKNVRTEGALVVADQVAAAGEGR